MFQPRSFFRAGMLLVMLSACAFAFAPPQESAARQAEARKRIIEKLPTQLEADAISRVEPIYPPVARWAAWPGTSKNFAVELLINEAGDVIDANAVSGHPLLKNAMVTAARGWKFKPAQVEGRAVKVRGI